MKIQQKQYFVEDVHINVPTIFKIVRKKNRKSLNCQKKLEKLFLIWIPERYFSKNCRKFFLDSESVTYTISVNINWGI